jgi:hypothetical protein
MFELV